MQIENPKILVLGATGLLGNMVFRLLSEDSCLRVCGTVRNKDAVNYFSPELQDFLEVVHDLTSLKELQVLINTIKPNIVINCVSVGRPIPLRLEFLIPLLSVLPMRLSYLCSKIGARLIHVSSDGVFSGQKGMYSEGDIPDSGDAYGIAKALGEAGGDHVILRTSLLGPELAGGSGLLEWLISQSIKCKGYTHSIFSGVTTFEFAKCLKDVIIPNQNLTGVFNIASDPCSKFDLLKMIKSEYGLDVLITPDDSLKIDRSLSGVKLKKMTGYSPPKWENMLYSMRNYKFGLRAGI